MGWRSNPETHPSYGPALASVFVSPSHPNERHRASRAYLVPARFWRRHCFERWTGTTSSLPLSWKTRRRNFHEACSFQDLETDRGRMCVELLELTGSERCVALSACATYTYRVAQKTSHCQVSS